eukprot:403349547
MAVEKKLPIANARQRRDIEQKPMLLKPSSFITFAAKLSAELNAINRNRNPIEM